MFTIKEIPEEHYQQTLREIEERLSRENQVDQAYQNFNEKKINFDHQINFERLEDEKEIQKFEKDLVDELKMQLRIQFQQQTMNRIDRNQINDILEEKQNKILSIRQQQKIQKEEITQSINLLQNEVIQIVKSMETVQEQPKNKIVFEHRNKQQENISEYFKLIQLQINQIDNKCSLRSFKFNSWLNECYKILHKENIIYADEISQFQQIFEIVQDQKALTHFKQEDILKKIKRLMGTKENIFNDKNKNIFLQMPDTCNSTVEQSILKRGIKQTLQREQLSLQTLKLNIQDDHRNSKYKSIFKIR